MDPIINLPANTNTADQAGVPSVEEYPGWSTEFPAQKAAEQADQTTVYAAHMLVGATIGLLVSGCTFGAAWWYNRKRMKELEAALGTKPAAAT